MKLKTMLREFANLRRQELINNVQDDVAWKKIEVSWGVTISRNVIDNFIDEEEGRHGK